MIASLYPILLYMNLNLDELLNGASAIKDGRREFHGLDYFAWRDPWQRDHQIWRLLPGFGRPFRGRSGNFATLRRRLRTAVLAQQAARWRADAWAALAERITQRKVRADLLDETYPLGNRHPLLVTAREIQRLIASNETELLRVEFGWLPREEMELRAPRAADEPDIWHEFAAIADVAPEAESTHSWPNLRREATLPWRNALARWCGRRRRAERIRVESLHLDILRINHALAARARARAVELKLPEDEAFFLTADDLETGDVPAPEQLAARRREYEEACRAEHPPVLHFRDGERTTWPSPIDDPAAIRGVGVGSGTVTGTLIVDWEDAGDDGILFVPDTNPLYIGRLRPGRPVVAPRGGLLTHFAVIAREIGAPLFVAQVANLQPGQRVRIDFERGELHLV